MRQDPSPVIPAKAGIQGPADPPVSAVRYSAHSWTTTPSGVDQHLEFIVAGHALIRVGHVGQ